MRKYWTCDMMGMVRSERVKSVPVSTHTAILVLDPDAQCIDEYTEDKNT